jgi:hypothetical protein
MEGRESLRQRRDRLQRQWSRWMNGDGAAQVRGPIAESWQRTLAVVDPERDSAPVEGGGDIAARWARSPLREPVAAVADELRTIADDADFVAAVTDESGTILWTCGGRVMRRRAGAVNFAPGGRWDESAMGTNALSLALRTGTATAVFSAEHFVHALHGWVCYCAPIHAPDGRVLGVLDLSSTWDRAHPLGMPTVRSLATGIQSRLQPKSLLPAATGAQLLCLGEATLLYDGVPVHARPRQLEILALLALEGHPVSPGWLHEALYGDRPIAAATLKAEVSHLRRSLHGALSTRRYDLTAPIGCDATDVLAALRDGRVETALRSYRGPLLPDSEAPGIVEWRQHIEVALREAVLRVPAPEPALRYGELHPEDLQIHERALALLSPRDTRQGVAVARYQAALDG